MIQIKALSKKFGSTTVVNNISLHIKKGEIFGLLGPNAAGKTTTIRMLCNLLSISSGEVSIAGINLTSNSDELKQKIGYVAQYFGLYDELTVFENLRFYTSLYGRVNDAELLLLLEKYKISEFKDAKAGALSGGYKRRLSLCCALSHNPDVLFLDEPTAGIDPVTRKALWDIFYELSEEGKTLFVTTHYMEEAERCNRIAFLNHGEIVAEGTPDEVENSLETYHIFKLSQKFSYPLLRHLQKEERVHLVNQFGNELRVMVNKELTLDALSKIIAPFLDEPPHLELTKANLEDVFIALTQEDAS